MCSPLAPQPASSKASEEWKFSRESRQWWQDPRIWVVKEYKKLRRGKWVQRMVLYRERFGDGSAGGGQCLPRVLGCHTAWKTHGCWGLGPHVVARIVWNTVCKHNKPKSDVSNKPQFEFVKLTLQQDLTALISNKDPKVFPNNCSDFVLSTSAYPHEMIAFLHWVAWFFFLARIKFLLFYCEIRKPLINDDNIVLFLGVRNCPVYFYNNFLLC